LPAGKQDQSDYLELFDDLIDAAARPYWDNEARFNVIEAVQHAGALTKLAVPAMEASLGTVARTQSKLRALRVLNAILAREQAGKTDEPKLGDLGLPQEVTTDSFNGKPLILKKTPSGWLIYSVSQNLKDDGGKLDDEQTDFGLGPAPAAGKK
jgi:hypothetical protein